MILHLVAKSTWESRPTGSTYLPDAYTKDGFIHCTQGDDLLLQVANRFYKTVPGDFLVLDIDESKVTAQIKWEASASPTPVAPTESAPVNAVTPPLQQQPYAEVMNSDAMPPEAKAEFGTGSSVTPTAESATGMTHESLPASAAPLFPHIYGPLNLDAIVSIRRMVRSADGAFTRLVLIDTSAPQGMNLKKPSQLANELVDATGEFSDALARYKDKLEAHMDELDKNIKSKLG